MKKQSTFDQFKNSLKRFYKCEVALFNKILGIKSSKCS